MAEVSGEACEKFLEENKKLDGVVVLPSGLQYKVMKYGTGIAHPMVNCTCECHYAGALIDGTEFDSSYKRGQPSPFAPNQVIKGWTEALQLMVEGDKWELYIPYQLAYGESGRPPKIPAKAALVFQMEIIRIRDTKNTVPVTYPEWTEEEKKLLTDKDEEPIKKWREDRTKLWEEGQMRDKHPTKEGFEEWLDRASQSSRNKALWKRTRMAKNKVFEDAIKPPRQLPKEQARELLDKVMATFKQPENKEKLLKIVEQCDGQDAAQAGLTKMMTLKPAVEEMMGGLMKEYDYKPEDMLTVVMQIQAWSSEDASIAADVGKLFKAVQGDFSELFA
mmetsp:Transcript_1782/g.2346  ORF Transcript_1782/g.2346 Transcript_1782/m.2346 type:complete len:333 (+) Transcript_1782:63-1061(+)|eukprot:CAMPEP_0206471672 /NCGR_PEP_ID=MMETSP0324_2-20121206/31713_1 /ASSEMBLY_ACC=CAM_ASM_000836 /TAXON_ID=2866 /ORGANISM="Crypthecodinium cohnii, Strain Seligo" /LENGTH=332 /DNA_ID=CAMNT_0053946063 /DNA_START=77 /DNA_END=1075 /DNA_ORIENTATION=+